LTYNNQTALYPAPLTAAFSPHAGRGEQRGLEQRQIGENIDL
jgi:hypothetical protein